MMPEHYVESGRVMSVTTAGELVKLAQAEERERCAQIAMNCARAISKGTIRRPGSIEEIGQVIANAIRKD